MGKDEVFMCSASQPRGALCEDLRVEGHVPDMPDEAGAEPEDLE
jgi:hypothetical protein